MMTPVFRMLDLLRTIGDSSGVGSLTSTKFRHREALCGEMKLPLKRIDYLHATTDCY